MALSYYATTRPGALAVAMNSSTTQVAMVSATTFPDPTGPGNGQYTIIIGYGSDREEVCTVTAKSGDTLTVLRAQDSTAATGKNQGDVVVHGVSARDFKGFIASTDSRLTDARTPKAHAASHATAGADAITPASIGAATSADVTTAVNAAVTQMTTFTNQAIPIGGIIMWSGTTAPTGWALCNGLNGTPNLVDKFIVGMGNQYALAATGGATTVTLTTAQMPTHNHRLIDPNNPGGYDFSIHALEPDFAAQPGAWYAPTRDTPQSPGVTTENQGGGAAHQNLPPYYALAYIQRKT